MENPATRQDVSDLWDAAINKYKETLRSGTEDLTKTFDIRMRFQNVDDMINFGDNQTKLFGDWRHDKSKMSQIRTLLRTNIELIEIGTEKLLAAATPAFPPASIISTALTFVLAGCKSVSADYDVVTNFLNVMSNFLRRVKILQGRLPRSGEYQSSLTEVFTALLSMCAVATKFVTQGRVKKLFKNTFFGEDGDLADARSNVQDSLDKLKQATEFAILANTEDTLTGLEKISRMQDELTDNSKEHTALLHDQKRMLEDVLQQQQLALKDLEIIKKIVSERNSQQKTSLNSGAKSRNKAKGIRTIIPENFDNIAELKLLQESRLTQTCQWLFEDDNWKTWFKARQDTSVPPLLTLHGPPGIGKSYLAVAAYNHLQALNSHESSEKTCVASFICRKGVAALGSFRDVIDSVILQISDQNVLIYEQINAELAKDEEFSQEEYFTKLVAPIFRQESQYMLYVIVDAVNELESEKEIAGLRKMIEMVIFKSLNIKILITSHYLLPEIGSLEIPVNKVKVLPDIEKLTEDRLNSTDSAYQGIRRLHAHVKKKIASEVKEKADGLLYANVALRYLSNIGREGAILKELSNSLPSSAAGFLEKDMDQCWRRTPDNLTEAMRVLLAWLTFGFDSLTLNGANALVLMYSSDQDLSIEDEIEGVYGRVLQTTSTLRPAAPDEVAKLPSQAFRSDPFDKDTAFDDRDVMVTFRYRAMKELLSTRETDASKHKSCFPRSAAHRAMFLLCFRLIEEHQEITDKSTRSTGYYDLYHYALKYCLRHWQNIDCGQHTEDENVVVLNSFATLLSNRHYLAAQTEDMGYGYTIDLLVSTHLPTGHESWSQKFLEDWNKWSQWLADMQSSTGSLQQARLKSGFNEYWSSTGDKCVLPLAKAHVDNWLKATEEDEAQKSYYFARKAIQMTHLRGSICPDFPEDDWKEREPIRGRDSREGIDEIYAIRSLSGLTIDSNACWATALIISACGFLDSEKFLHEIENSSNNPCDSFQEFRTLILYSEYYQRQDQSNSSRDCLETALELRDRNQVPPRWVARALKKLTEFEEDNEGGTRSLFKQIRALDPDFFVPAEIILAEFRYYHYYGTPDQVLGLFAELTETQRLTLLSCFWLGVESWVHRWLFLAAEAKKAGNELIRLYEEVVKVLDQEGSGAVWRRYLAQLHRTLSRDDETAKAVLIKAINTECTTRQFELFKLDTGLVAMQIVNAMSDIIYEQFRKSVKPADKSTLLEEARDLMKQPFPESVQINSTSTIPHLLVVASMVRKIGRAEDWQKCMLHVFDIVWTNLHDTIDWNDGINIRYLSRILAQMPNLSRDAQIVGSAQYRFLDNSSAFQKFLKQHGRADLYDSQSEMRLQKWIENQPNFFKYVRGKKLQFDTTRAIMVSIAPKLSEREQKRRLRAMMAKVKLDPDNDNDDREDDEDYEDDDDREDDTDHEDDEDHEDDNDYNDDDKVFAKLDINRIPKKLAEEPLDPVELRGEEYWFNKFSEKYLSSSGSDLKGLSSTSRCAGCNDPSVLHEKTQTFTCLVCTDSMLCEDCHDYRMEMNLFSKLRDNASFCCDGGRYLEIPVAGWQGFHDGKLHIEGEEPLEWKEYLRGVKTRWDEAWVDFWRD